MLKYTIYEKMKSLNQKDYEFAIKQIPKLMAVGTSTFYRWMRIGINEKAEISAKHLFDLAAIFECDAQDLFNYKSPMKPFSKLRIDFQIQKKSVAKRHGLSKLRKTKPATESVQ
jgi:hypothetical protein